MDDHPGEVQNRLPNFIRQSTSAFDNLSSEVQLLTHQLDSVSSEVGNLVERHNFEEISDIEASEVDAFVGLRFSPLITWVLRLMGHLD